MSTDTVQEGMEVFGADGEKIGTVKEVWPAAGGTSAAGLGAEIPALPPDLAPVQSAAPALASDQPGTATAGTGYIHVEQGGVLGIGAKDLYIPHAAVSDILPDQKLTVNCTKEECTERYSAKPDAVDHDLARWEDEGGSPLV